MRSNNHSLGADNKPVWAQFVLMCADFVIKILSIQKYSIMMFHKYNSKGEAKYTVLLVDVEIIIVWVILSLSSIK